jgi:hypothetical protein
MARGGHKAGTTPGPLERVAEVVADVRVRTGSAGSGARRPLGGRRALSGPHGALGPGPQPLEEASPLERRRTPVILLVLFLVRAASEGPSQVRPLLLESLFLLLELAVPSVLGPLWSVWGRNHAPTVVGAIGWLGRKLRREPFAKGSMAVDPQLRVACLESPEY